MKNIKKALVNESTATAILDAPDALQAVAIVPVSKPKQFMVGASEKTKGMIEELSRELQVKGKTGKLIDLPTHATLDMILEIATDYRFRTSEDVDGTFQTFDRFEDFRVKFEIERNQERVQTPAEMIVELKKLQARMRAYGMTV